MDHPAWVQPPTRTLCVEQCGAACCQGVGSFTLTPDEAQRLYRVVGPLVLYDEGDDRWRLNFSDHGGRCPALEPDNTCRLYAARPQACRRYPSQPDPRCAVWPARKES